MLPNKAKVRKKGTGGQKFDQHLASKLYKELRRGVPLDVALDFLGFGINRFWRWYRKGELFLKNEGDPAHHAAYGDFVVKCKRAAAIFMRRRITGLYTDAWRANLAILERRDRKNWSKKAPLGGSMENYDPDERFL